MKEQTQNITVSFSSLVLLFLISFSFSCAPVRVVRTLDKGEFSASASLGGPLVKLGGATIPIPFSSLSASYGIEDRVTAFAGVHTTSLLFGVIQTDIGAAWQISKPNKWKPGFSVSPCANLMVDKWEGNFRLYPSLDVNAFWEYSERKNFFYAGASGWLDLRGMKAHEVKQENRFVPSFQLGHNLVLNRWDLITELKWLAPLDANNKVVAEYVGINDRGALGVYLGLRKRF